MGPFLQTISPSTSRWIKFDNSAVVAGIVSRWGRWLAWGGVHAFCIAYISTRLFSRGCLAGVADERGSQAARTLTD